MNQAPPPTRWGGRRRRGKQSILQVVLTNPTVLGYLFALFVLFGCGGYAWVSAYTSYFGGGEEEVVEPARAANGEPIINQDSAALAAQLAPTRPPPTPTAIPTETPSPTPTNFLDKPDWGKRLLIGSVVLERDFGDCAQSNVGFSAGGDPFFLWVKFEDLPEGDLRHKQVQVSGQIIAQPEHCEHPLLKVSDIRISGDATPEPFLLYRSYGLTQTDTITSTLLKNTDQLITPTATISASVVRPYNADQYVGGGGVDGQPLPTATPQPANFVGILTTVTDCTTTNFAVRTQDGERLLWFSEGVLLPDQGAVGQVTTVSGTAERICGRPAIKVRQVVYQPTATPVPTHTPKPTDVPDATKTPVPTSTPPTIIRSGVMVRPVTGNDLTDMGMMVEGVLVYLYFNNIAAAPADGQSLTVSGQWNESANVLVVQQVVLATPTPSPTFTPSPTSTLIPTETPTPAPPTQTPTPQEPQEGAPVLTTVTVTPTPSVTPTVTPTGEPEEDGVALEDVVGLE